MDIVYVQKPDGSRHKILMLDGKVPKNSANPFELSQGQPVEVRYKAVLNHLVGIWGN